MRVWQDEPAAPEAPPEVVEHAEIWRAADTVVFATTLSEVSTPHTELQHAFVPAVVADLVASSDDRVSIGATTRKSRNDTALLRLGCAPADPRPPREETACLTSSHLNQEQHRSSPLRRPHRRAG